ncbi:MAG: cell surface protein [Clostridiaceae bacterium]|nr:cell surface protein [Clostridiaceae bacterium]
MKKGIKIILSLITAVTLMQLPHFAQAAGNINSTYTTNNLSEKYISASLNSSVLGGKPSTFKVIKSKTNLKKSTSSLPSAYDLRKLNLVTPADDQGSNGTCWAFAATGSLESYLLEKGYGTYNFSENNVVTGGSAPGYYYVGGNRDMATAYYAAWAGPVLQSTDADSLTSIVNRGSFTSAMHVQDVMYLPDRTSPLDNSELKSQIITNGAVDSSLYWDDYNYNESNYSYYDPYSSDRTDANHDIIIVGWDDNYPKENFLDQPAGNGAFICKNSWGTDFGDNGYFYVSYYDGVIGTDLTSFTAESSSNYNHIYQYDKNGYIYELPSGYNQIWFANVFQSSSKPESLAAVSTYFNVENTYYEVYCSIGSDSLTNLTKIKSGNMEKAGYRTIKLDNPVNLKPGEKYTVAIKFITSGNNAYAPVETDDYTLGIIVNAALGRSFVSADGSYWEDVNKYNINKNVALKAFTMDNTSSTASVVPDNSTKWPSKNTSDLNKVWNVKFSVGLDSTTINNSNVYIYDSLFQKINCNVVLDSDKKTLHISVPSGTYKSGQSYTLVVSGNVGSASGGKILKPVVMNFNIN